VPEGTEMTTKKPKKPQTFRLWLPDGPLVPLTGSCSDMAVRWKQPDVETKQDPDADCWCSPSNASCGPWNCCYLPLEV